MKYQGSDSYIIFDDNSELIPRISANVVYCEFHGGVSILNLANGSYFRLEDVGGLMWRLLAEGTALKTIASIVAKTYGIDPNTGFGDVVVFVDRLIEAGLVDEQGSPGSLQ